MPADIVTVANVKFVDTDFWQMGSQQAEISVQLVPLIELKEHQE